MNQLRRLATAAVVSFLVSLATPNAHAVAIDWVTVGSPGNANDTTGYGAVNAEYRIMAFEFTNSQYVAFLNAVDPDGSNPNSIWNSSMDSGPRGGISQNLGAPTGSRYAVKSNMGNKPANYVGWWDAARVSNWLHNGAQTYGSTDASATAPQNTGAYSVGTATSGTAVPVNPGALFYLPTENQWYKAAFYNPTLNTGAGGYRLYANGFSAQPTAVTANGTGDGSAGGIGNFANYNAGADWNGQDGNVTTVGTNGGASYYGTFDQSGNVWEWNDLTGLVTGSTRGIRGADYFFPAFFMSSSYRDESGTSNENDNIGFRLAAAAVPEPSTYAMALAAIACGGFTRWRRRTRA